MPKQNFQPLAYHSIFGFYGFWLPNDPRGSGSDYVGSLALLKFGRATKVDTRHSVAGKSHDNSARLAAKRALKSPPLRITGKQALLVAGGFGQAINEGDYRILACAIMPDHVHMVIAGHSRPIRKIIGHLKARATSSLKARDEGPGEGRPIWGALGWNLFLADDAAIERAIRYVQRNPTQAGLKRQRWSFVANCIQATV